MAGIHGLGAKLILASTAAATTITELTNIGEISMTAADIDVSSHATRVKTYLKGLIDMGEVPFTGNYQIVQGPAIMAHLVSKASTSTQSIVVPGKFKITFPGYLKGFSFGVSHENKVGMSGSIKISGLATLLTST